VEGLIIAHTKTHFKLLQKQVYQQPVLLLNLFMRFRFLLFLILLSPTVVMAQSGMIKGKVMSTDLQIPLNEASVFLTNSTYGTATASDGTFTLANLKPGQYELVVSYVGYESYHQTIMVAQDVTNLKIDMHLKSYGLGEVSVVSHKFSKENFAMFLKYFLGTSLNAKQCRIANPKVVDLYYNQNDKVLEGHSDDFILIENRALGYRLKYLLNSFKYDGINEIISYGGQPLYEDLKGSKSQKERWHKAREDAYYGSSMHFYRSLLHNELAAQGFKIYHLVRTPNPERPPQYMIVKKIDKFEAQGNIDSANYWKRLYNLRKYIETLGTLPLLPEDILTPTDRPDIFGFTFPHNLYVIYTKKLDEMVDDKIYRPLDMKNFMVSIITLYTKYAFFDLNGVVISNKATLYEGAWARNKIPEMLPVDYAPDDKKAKLN
jgi:hypothetical protein